MRMRRLWVEAIRKSNLSISQKLQLRLVLLNPFLLDSLNDFLAEKSNLVSVQDVEAMADGRIIELILDNLPEIIEFIKVLIGLFS